MKKLLPLLLLFALPLPAQARTPRVVATVPDLAAIAEEVLGPDVEVPSLALATQDPHFVDAKPSLALALSRADLLLTVGLELEIGWLPTLVTSSRNPRLQPGGGGAVDCSQFVDLLGVPTMPVDRSMGDVHAQGNPHYLFDPRNAVPVARGIAAKLAELDPEGAPGYRARAEDFARRTGEAVARWERELADLRGRPIITYHRSFPYLAAWLGFEIVEEVEPRPGISPTPKHVAQVLVTARDKGVPLVLQESYYPDRASKLVAEKAGAALVVLPAGTHEGETYLEHAGEIVALIRKGLGG